MPLGDLAIRNRARAVVDEVIDSPQIVRNSFFPTAYQWLTFIETWAGGSIASQTRPTPRSCADGQSRAGAEPPSA